MADPGLFRQVTERVAGGSLVPQLQGAWQRMQSLYLSKPKCCISFQQKASAADASALARNKLREAAETATWQEGHPPEAPDAKHAFRGRVDGSKEAHG